MADSDRLEREIEEILGKIEQFPVETRAARDRQRALHRAGDAISSRQHAFARELSRISISQVILLSFLMILGAFFFRAASPLVMDWLMYAGIILFVSSFAIMMFGGGRRRRSQQTWRGRTIDVQSGPTLSQRLRRWWEGRSIRH